MQAVLCRVQNRWSTVNCYMYGLDLLQSARRARLIIILGPAQWASALLQVMGVFFTDVQITYRNDALPASRVPWFRRLSHHFRGSSARTRLHGDAGPSFDSSYYQADSSCSPYPPPTVATSGVTGNVACASRVRNHHSSASQDAQFAGRQRGPPIPSHRSLASASVRIMAARLRSPGRRTRLAATRAAQSQAHARPLPSRSAGFVPASDGARPGSEWGAGVAGPVSTPSSAMFQLRLPRPKKRSRMDALGRGDRSRVGLANPAAVPLPGPETLSSPSKYPPWDAFPAEQYLIGHWDPSSSSSPSDQRRELIRAFMQLETIPKAWDATGREAVDLEVMSRVPTADEKDRNDEAIWLRTHYGAGDDKFAEWRAIDEDYDPTFDEGDDSGTWTKLDDPDLFAFGERWGRVFDVLPELAGPQQGYSRAFFNDISRADFLSTRQKLMDAIIRAEDVEEEIEAGIGMQLQVMAVATYLLVADAEAFESGKLRILYLDARGNVVRHSRIEPEDVFEARSRWNAAKLRDGEWWLEKDVCTPGGALGGKYRAGGEMSRGLYGIEDFL
ncbi:hypothetical protein F4781DRAFT_443032 [Annulohypoxylon bovei var. microspora]|nr:hypothetical protein F4781DRAFT_443032 [Annulohypoxylon bovei var. microspora]